MSLRPKKRDVQGKQLERKPLTYEQLLFNLEESLAVSTALQLSLVDKKSPQENSASDSFLKNILNHSVSQTEILTIQKTPSLKNPIEEPLLQTKKRENKVFNFFFSLKEKTIPDYVLSIPQKIFKGLNGIFEDLAGKLRGDQDGKNTLNETANYYNGFTQVLSFLSSVFTWYKWRSKLAHSSEDIKEEERAFKMAVEEGERQEIAHNVRVKKVTWVLELLKAPFLAMQTALPIIDLKNIVEKLKDIAFKSPYKPATWLFKAIAYFGVHLISPVLSLITLYNEHQKAKKRGEQVSSRIKKDAINLLVKEAVVLVFSAAVVIIATQVLGGLNTVSSLGDPRALFLGLITILDNVYKYCPHFFGATRSWIQQRWNYLQNLSSEEVQQGFINFFKNIRNMDSQQWILKIEEMNQNLLRAMEKGVEKIGVRIKQFGRAFRGHQEKQLKLSLIEGKITALKLVKFILNASLLLVGLLSTFIDLSGAALLASYMMPALIVIGSALFLFSAAIFIENLIRYQDRNIDREVCADKMVMQGVKMGLSALVVGLCVWAVAAAFPLWAMAIVAGVALATFYGYIGLSRKFSAKGINNANLEVTDKGAPDAQSKEVWVALWPRYIRDLFRGSSRETNASLESNGEDCVSTLEDKPEEEMTGALPVAQKVPLIATAGVFFSEKAEMVEMGAGSRDILIQSEQLPDRAEQPQKPEASSEQSLVGRESGNTVNISTNCHSFKFESHFSRNETDEISVLFVPR